MHRSVTLMALLLATALTGCAALGDRDDPDAAPPEEAVVPVDTESDDPRDQVLEATDTEDIEYGDFPADVLYALLSAEIAAHRGHFDVTLRNYLQAAEATGDQGILERGVLIAQALQAGDALEQFAEIWLKKDPKAPTALRVAAVHAIREARFDDAMTYMERLFEQGEDADFENLAGYAQTLPAEQQDELIELFKSLRDRYPDEPDISYSLALIQHAANDNEAALDTLEPVLIQHQHYQPAITLKGKLLFDMGRQEEAREHLRTASRRYPDNQRLGTLYARTLLEAGELQEAEDEFETLMNRFPQNTGLKLARALVALENDNVDTAEPLLESLIQQGVHTHDAHYYLGRIAQDRGDYEQAVGHYQQVREGSQFFDALARASYLQARQGETFMVLEQLERERREAPHQAEQIWLIEINLLLDLDKSEQALAATRGALDKFPANSNIQYVRAMLLYEHHDDIDGMEEELRDILEREPDNAIALNALGYVLADRTDRTEEAYEYIKRAYELEPENPAIIDSLGWVKYRLGELEEALELLTEAYEAMPDPEIAAHLGEVLWQKGRRDDARVVWRRALADADESDDIDVLLDTLERFDLTPEDL